MSRDGSCMPEGAFSARRVLRREAVGDQVGGDTTALHQDVTSVTPCASPSSVVLADESVVEQHRTELWEETKNPSSHKAHPSWVFTVELVRVSKEARSKDVAFSSKSSSQRDRPVLVHLVQSLGQPRQVVSTRENPSRQVAHPRPFGVSC